jgi:hypothetical protein
LKYIALFLRGGIGMVKKRQAKSDNIQKKEKFPMRVFIPTSGWCLKINKSVSAGYRNVIDEADYEAVKHLIGEDKTFFRGEKL